MTLAPRIMEAKIRLLSPGDLGFRGFLRLIIPFWEAGVVSVVRDVRRG